MAVALDCALNSSSLDAASMLLKFAISTVASPVSLKLMIVYRDYDFCGIAPCGTRLCEVSEADRAGEALRHHRRFEVLREVRKARDFQLVLFTSRRSPVVEYSVRMLKEAVADEKAHWGFEGVCSVWCATDREGADLD